MKCPYRLEAWNMAIEQVRSGSRKKGKGSLLSISCEKCVHVNRFLFPTNRQVLPILRRFSRCRRGVQKAGAPRVAKRTTSRQGTRLWAARATRRREGLSPRREASQDRTLFQIAPRARPDAPRTEQPAVTFFLDHERAHDSRGAGDLGSAEQHGSPGRVCDARDAARNSALLALRERHRTQKPPLWTWVLRER